MVIPALHDAASYRPFANPSHCGHAAGLLVCVNPAYGRWLPNVTVALTPVFSELAGLPGAPVRAVQVGAVYDNADGGGSQAMTISGQPLALSLPLGALHLPDSSADSPSIFAAQLRLLAVHAFTGAGAGPGTPAQQAVQAALLQGAGVPFDTQPEVLADDGLPSWTQTDSQRPGPAIGPVYDAARRLAALPGAARHVWLATHLAALRSGQLTVAQLP
jgi:hypothetical protein